MDWLQAPDYWLTRLVFERALALIYVVAFLVVINQFRPLLGERGLLPVPAFLRLVSFRQAPSIFHLRYSDRLAVALGWLGAVLSTAIVLGVLDVIPDCLSIPWWLVVWALYLSFVNVGQTFYGFGWESLLLEVGLLVPLFGAGQSAPPTLILFLLRWVLFRLEFGAGLIKLRGDPCWRDLTCLYYHHETQPMPNPLSWYFHHLARVIHRGEVLGSHFAQLVVPFGLFAPQPVAGVCGAIIVASQTWLVLSGNFSWLNFLTIALAFTAFDDSVFEKLIPITHHVSALSSSWQALSIALAIVVAGLSYLPARNLVSRGQLMNFSFNPIHFVNTYGAFGSITRVRYEIVLEGTESLDAGGPAEWKEYEFKGKPGDPKRRPPQIAPYHLRLDWLMWFAAMSPPMAHPWLVALIVKLLRNDQATLKLLRHNPFPEHPPAQIRARRFRYRFTSRGERRATGCWWNRALIGDYLPPISLRATPEPP